LCFLISSHLAFFLFAVLSRSSIRGAPAQLLPGQRSENNSKRASTDAESTNEVDTVEDEVDEQVGEMVSAREEEAERCVGTHTHTDRLRMKRAA
jgi:hypothetical protein